MSDFIERLIESLRPTISDLDNRLEELENNHNELTKVSNMLDYVSGDMKKISKYDDQTFILENLEIIDSNENEYTANCYLLNSDDDHVKTLPQYNKAKSYFEKFITCFKMHKEELSMKTSELEKICDEKKMNKKYHDIFKMNNPLVSDVDEFNEFIKKQEIAEEDKINILLCVIKNNVSSYKE